MAGSDQMYYNKVEISGVNTAKLKVLKESEKIELLKKIKDGDMKAREELINGNLRLVLSVIQRFTGRGENPDDLFQVGQDHTQRQIRRKAESLRQRKRRQRHHRILQDEADTQILRSGKDDPEILRLDRQPHPEHGGAEKHGGIVGRP